MSLLRNSISSFLILYVAILTTTGIAGDKSALTKKQRLAVITRCTTAILSKNHYRQQKLDNNISSKLFEQYFKVLDPVKIYFTQQDVMEFEQYRYYLDDMAQIGNSDFALKVYNLLMKRMEMYENFSKEQLKKGFDFTRKESFAIKRNKMPRAANMDEMKEVWRKKLKNDVLYLRLMAKNINDKKTAKQPTTATNTVSTASKVDTAQQTGKTAKVHVSWKHKTPKEKIMTRLHDNLNSMKQKDDIDILGFYLTALALVYGPHSSYMPPKSEEDFNIDMKLSLVGIGAVLTTDAGYTKIVKLIPGGPAEKAGQLKANDRIIAVAQENEQPVDVVDMSISRVVKQIRGEKGTKVTLTILPAAKGVNAIPVNITITRDKVVLKESEAQSKIKTMPMPDGSKAKIGIINLSKFYIDFEAYYKGDPNYMSASRDIRKILEKFNSEGVDGAIIDLRNNGGGSLMEAINLTGLFIKDGPVVQVRRSNGNISIKEDPDAEIVFSKPLIVLTNKLTSSASEIFAGAIKDYQRGILIGDSRTYGKGTVLDVFPIKRLLEYINQDFPAGVIKYESAMFYRINGDSTQQRGVKPDIVFPSITEEMEFGEQYNTNSLPWGKIAADKHDIYEKDIAKMIKKLDLIHKKRLEKSARLKILDETIKNYRKYRQRKTVSLNEKDRLSEYLKEKKIYDEQEKMLRQSENADKKSGDLCLDESTKIMRDYIWFSGPGR
ncbi:MAG: carboxy terminal-processing peptidase [Victivallaceae bacterium]|nr:carboxy terminal-processing peptidase [Victivallaceae bacterium]